MGEGTSSQCESQFEIGGNAGFECIDEVKYCPGALVWFVYT